MHQSWDHICSLTLQIIEEAHAFAFHAECVDQMEGCQDDEVWHLFLDGRLQVLLEIFFSLLILVYALMI